LAFDLPAIFITGAAACLYAAFIRARGRGWALLVASVLAVYWLQPPLAIRFSDYILPTLAISLTVISWWLTRSTDPTAGDGREDRRSFILIAALVIGLAFMRYVDADFRLTASRPPNPLFVSLALVLAALLTAGLAAITRHYERNKILTTAILAIVGLFIILKTEPLAAAVSGWWRSLTNQDTSLAGIGDLNWLGFSYVAFRLIHTMRDRQTGLLPALSLREYVTYVIFFPAYIAGPIDRAERFVGDLRALPTMAGLDAGRFSQGFSRIVTGLFKKFVIADSLAQGMALTTANAVQTTSQAGLWLLLYGYAMRLYFDFSGYTDIAIGLAILFGIRLPENFHRPYLKTSITAFWQSWHITLSNWVRFYVFSPLSRWLLKRKPRPSPTLIVLLSQTATMVVIGLWHGVSWNFLIWGLWHGLGLFIHKQWSDRTRKWYRGLEERPRQRIVWAGLGWFITFNFVTLGWVWFALPTPGLALRTFGRLFGWGW
jgi:alginate O-acetyltransferase complex protein AlgI